MKRRLSIAVVEERGNTILFKIIVQTHRCEGFTDKGSTFRAKNGTKLESCSCPEATSNTIFVRGDGKHLDDTILHVKKEQFQLIKEAIKEYNDLYGERIELPNDLFVL